MGRGGGKPGSLGNALLAIFNKLFRVRYLRGVLQDRKRDPDWSKQEEARVCLFCEFSICIVPIRVFLLFFQKLNVSRTTRKTTSLSK